MVVINKKGGKKLIKWFKKKDEEKDMDLLLTLDNVDGLIKMEVCHEDGDSVISPTYAIPKEEVKKYPMETGGILYTCNMDEEAQIQAEKIKELKESALLQGLFHDSGSENRMNMQVIVPIVIISIVAIVFTTL